MSKRIIHILNKIDGAICQVLNDLTELLPQKCTLSPVILGAAAAVLVIAPMVILPGLISASLFFIIKMGILVTAGSYALEMLLTNKDIFADLKEFAEKIAGLSDNSGAHLLMAFLIEAVEKRFSFLKTLFSGAVKIDFPKTDLSLLSKVVGALLGFFVAKALVTTAVAFTTAMFVRAIIGFILSNTLTAIGALILNTDNWEAGILAFKQQKTVIQKMRFSLGAAVRLMKREMSNLFSAARATNQFKRQLNTTCERFNKLADSVQQFAKSMSSPNKPGRKSASDMISSLLFTTESATSTPPKNRRQKAG